MKNVFVFVALLVALSIHAMAEDPQAIVKAMEAKMNPNAKTEMVLITVNDQGESLQYSMTSYAKSNNQKIIVRLTAPASEIGNDLIMLDRNVWAYDQATGREVKIPSNQSFGNTGFSYGDVLRLNFSDNYTPVQIAEDAKSWTIELTSKRRDAPYFRVVQVISKDYSPLEGTCFARDGKVIKTIRYSNVKDLGQGSKPLTITVQSSLSEREVSSLTVVKEVVKDYPDNIFNKRNLAAHLEDKF